MKCFARRMEKRDRDTVQTSIFPSMEGADSSSSSSPSSIARRRHGSAAGSSDYRLGSWLMRKLLKHRKMLMCVDSKPATIRCQYDPVSYSRNFDDSGFGTALDDVDSTHFCHTFSSRFVNKANSRVAAAATAATADGLAAGCSR